MSRIYSEHWKDYELIDAGGSKKLERWGEVITIRPERNAYFGSKITHEEWKKRAHFEFVEETTTKGNWIALKEGFAKEWTIEYNQLKLKLALTQFKHTGLFPEQEINWKFINENIKEGQKFLNLFAYTGAVSLVARAQGADVFHCDSVKQVLGWGKENMELSGLSDIHWVLEDAVKFAQREVKRGKKYDGIIMDPPAFGIGAKKKRWKIEQKIEELIATALELKSDTGFIIINTYSPKMQEFDIIKLIQQFGVQGGVDTLCVKTTTGKVLEYGLRTLIY